MSINKKLLPKKQNILIITEAFTYGGLETYIREEIKELTANGVNTHLVCGEIFMPDFVPKETASIISGLPIKINASVDDLLRSVSRIREIIKSKKINVVHAHPFMSNFPAYIAARLEKVPFFITLHGPASIGGTYGAYYDFINSLIIGQSDKVIATSEEIMNIISPYATKNNIKLQPNSVNATKYSGNIKAKSINKWLLAGRLDDFKTRGMKVLVEYVLSYDQKSTIDIAGDGDNKENFVDWCHSKGYDDRVNFIGLVSDLPSVMRDYDAVAGMGRVLLEGVACGVPVCLVGYDGVKGMVNDVDNFNVANFANFSGRNISNVSTIDFFKQIATFDYKKYEDVVGEVKRNYDQKIVWKRFVESIPGIVYKNNTDDLLLDIYTRISGYVTNSNDPWIQSSAVWNASARVVASDKYSSSTAATSFQTMLYEDRLLNLSKEVKEEIHQRDADTLRFKAEIDGLSKRVRSNITNFKDDILKTITSNYNQTEMSINSVKLIAQDNALKKDQQIQNLQKLVNSKRFRLANNLANFGNKMFFGVSTTGRVIDGLVDLPRSLKRKIRNKNIYQTIKESGLFDADYYLRNNDDVRKNGVDPLLHYVSHGSSESRRPNKDFDPAFYLEEHLDVRKAGVEPLYHYIKFGMSEKRAIAKKVDPDAIYSNYVNMWIGDRSKLLNLKQVATKEGVVAIKNSMRRYKSKYVIAMPLSYPLDMAQRPDHIFRYMANQGIPTLLIQDSTEPPFIKEHRPGVFVTNMKGEALKWLDTRRVILYISYPYYSYFNKVIKPSILIYDVLDELSCFSGDKRLLEEEHKKLLEASDLVLYSSKLLMEKDADKPKKKSLLVENGVWIEDFSNYEHRHTVESLRKNSKEIIIGYYGAISNLLDWNLLKAIASIKNVRLVMIGQKADFDNVNVDNDVHSLRETVLAMSSVTYISTVKYEDLVSYSCQFDAAIVPFVMNDITNSVSPLKLFEYMAVGCKIFATNTQNLLRYKKYITVNGSSGLIEDIEQWVSGYDKRESYSEKYLPIIESVNWNNKLTALMSCIKEISPDQRAESGKNVDIINVNFYDWSGKVVYKGGAERYVYDLAVIARSMGYKPRIIQNATDGFTRDYRGIEVIGVKTGIRGTGGNDLRLMSKKYNEVCRDADLIIASPVDLAVEITVAPVIGINHGIYWDSKWQSLENYNFNNYKVIFDALSRSKLSVCVDTNFINWTRTYDYSLGEKLRYIPNYYDKNQFKPKEKAFDGKIIALYPRRLYEARGIYETLGAFNVLIDKYSDLNLLLVGQTDDVKVKKAVAHIMKRYPNRVSLEEHDMENMPVVYNRSHISLIPTQFAEGTSLSCLEAMATNNAVIATNIGGLPNLITDGYNGLLIHPSTESLINAIEFLMDNRVVMKSYASKALDTSLAFEKDRWDNKWREILGEELK